MAQASAREHEQHMRFHTETAHLGSAFGGGSFGQVAEGIAHFFGTPQYLIGQTLVVIVWIIVNIVVVTARFDPYPFILLNLAFSTQAAYAAPLILLAQTRQADRDKAWTAADAQHREELAQNTLRLLQQNTDLTTEVERLSREVHELTAQIHQRIVVSQPSS